MDPYNKVYFYFVVAYAFILLCCGNWDGRHLILKVYGLTSHSLVQDYYRRSIPWQLPTASARGLFDYDLNDRTRNNGAKLGVKHFNTSVAQHFYPIKITTTWNALPNEVVSSRRVISFKNSLDKHWAENPPNIQVNWWHQGVKNIIMKVDLVLWSVEE